MAPDKRRSPEKIDDMTALLMALGRAIVEAPGGNIDDFLRDPIIA